MIAKALKKMLEDGLEHDTIVAAVAALEGALYPPKSRHAVKQAAYRARQKAKAAAGNAGNDAGNNGNERYQSLPLLPPVTAGRGASRGDAPFILKKESTPYIPQNQAGNAAPESTVEPMPPLTGLGGAADADKEAKKAAEKARVAAWTADFEGWWKLYPKRLGNNPRKPALASYISARRHGATAKEIAAGIYWERIALMKHPEGNRIGTQFVPMASTWLNQERWKSYADKGEPPVIKTADQAQADRFGCEIGPGDGLWGTYLERFQRTGVWGDGKVALGPPPGTYGCQAPRNRLLQWDLPMTPTEPLAKAG